MGKRKGSEDPMAKLAALASGNYEGTEGDDDEELSPEEQAFVKDLNTILETAAKRCKNNVFDMQALIAAAGEELRLQIREQAED